MRKMLVALAFALAVIISASANNPAPVAAATTAGCTANPSSAVVGTRININCTGFDPNVIVNTYVVEPTGFTEIGDDDYTACLVNGQGRSGKSGKTNETGAVNFVWFTQNGVNTCPIRDYTGYTNQFGSYIVVVQELDGVGGIKTKGTVKVTLNGTSVSFTGAFVSATSSFVVVPGPLTFVGTGFAPNEAVNLWLTRPADCSGMGEAFWTGVSAFAPSAWGFMSGVSGPSTVKADSGGKIGATIQFGNPKSGDMPCTGEWTLTVHALGSGLGAETQFEVRGDSVLNNATVWTAESSVPSIGQMYDCESLGCGIAVHVYGSGFPPGSHVNCWFTRPDGTTYNGYPEKGGNSASAVLVDASGNFGALTLTFTSENGYQGEQPGRWAVTCGTPDKAYSGTAWFDVITLPDP